KRTPHRVKMNVIDYSQQRFAVLDVAVKAAARLPEEALDTVPSLASDFWQPARRVLANVRDAFAAHRLFDRFADDCHVVDWLAWANDQMHVFWHERIRPKGEVELDAGIVDRLLQPLTGAIGF